MDYVRRLQRTVVAVAALAVVGASVELAFASPSSAADTSYSAVGTTSYTVPAGVHALKVVATGAGGGKMFGNSGDGGAGAVVTAYLVNPGDTLTIKVVAAARIGQWGRRRCGNSYLPRGELRRTSNRRRWRWRSWWSVMAEPVLPQQRRWQQRWCHEPVQPRRGSTDRITAATVVASALAERRVATSNGANGGSSGAARGGGGGGGWNGGGGGLASGGGSGATGTSTSGGSNGDGGGGSGFGGGGGGFGGGGGGGYSGGGGGGSSDGTLLAGGGAGGSHAPSPAGWPTPTYAPGSNGGQANLGGNGRVTITEIFDQVVVGKCVKVRKLPSNHKKMVMKRNCLTNAGQRVTVSSTSKRAKFNKVTKGKKSKRGTYVKTKVRKKGKRNAVTITWSAPATATFTAYLKQKTYRI
jgi:hypothetical protein